jgi:hypothetical protein
MLGHWSDTMNAFFHTRGLKALPTLAGAVLAAVALMSTAAHAGPYAPAAGQTGSTAVSKSSASIVQWASGYMNYQPGSNLDATWQTPAKALGAAQGTSTDIVGLGDGGSITLTFANDIVNGAGADFAVFENSFSDTYLELAWVEVSSNGIDFFRFPGVSFTASPVNGFGNIDPTNLNGLAGKYRQGFGTPFDLSVLSGKAGLDVNHVKYVRIVDIIGNGTQLDNYPTALGGPHPIYDPYPTSGSAGFDLDAVGVMNMAAASTAPSAVPEPSAWWMLLSALGVGLALNWRKRLASRRSWGSALIAGGLMASGIAQAATPVVSTFDDLSLAANSHYMPGTSTSFVSGAASFKHSFNEYFPGCCWSGWTYSNETDTSTPGYLNQYSAITGGGAGGSANYAVAYFGAPVITLAAPSLVNSVSVTNTTYAGLAMKLGDGFSKRFGGDDGTAPDFLKLTITGVNAAGVVTGSVDTYLADFRFADSAQDYILDQWRTVSLASLGAVQSLRFSLASSDTGEYGINTPAYFAMDNLSVTAVPEPSACLLALAGVFMVAGLRRRALAKP